MVLKLTKRLKAIVDMCDEASTIVDVGCDHGKVAIALANENMAKKIIASDINEQPLKQCKENIKTYLIDKAFDIETKVTDGLNGIMIDKDTAVLISGMGYDLIIKILKDIDNIDFKYMIISPHTKINEFVKFVDEKKLSILEERTVYEDNKAYFIFKIARGQYED